MNTDPEQQVDTWIQSLDRLEDTELTRMVETVEVLRNYLENMPAHMSPAEPMLKHIMTNLGFLKNMLDYASIKRAGKALGLSEQGAGDE